MFDPAHDSIRVMTDAASQQRAGIPGGGPFRQIAVGEGKRQNLTLITRTNWSALKSSFHTQTAHDRQEGRDLLAAAAFASELTGGYTALAAITRSLGVK